MSLAGLLSVIADDPQLRRALDLGHTGEDAGGPGRCQPRPGWRRRRPGRARAPTGTLAGGDLVGPAELRPFLAAALAAAGRPVRARRHRHRPGGRRAHRRRSARCCPGVVACFPAWETLPHERLSPRSDTVGPAARGAAQAAPIPILADPVTGPLSVVVTPVRGLLQPIVAGLGDLEPVRLAPDQAADQDEVLARLVDIGYTRVDLVEQARRSRRPRRHPRRVPADRRAPAADRVLRRHGRGDPLLQGGRPAQPRARQRAVGTALPRAAAHPGGAGAGQGAGRRASRPGRRARQAGRRDRVEGMEAFAPALADADGAAA